jgi:transcriptional regulator with XRE-family HTH domain
MSDNVSSLGERLKRRREELGMSQAQAARELEVARTAYRLWELEAAKPSPDRWRLISRWLGVSVATMLLAEDLVDEEEARTAEVITGRFGPLRWDDEGGREQGEFFEQERSLIDRAEREGRLSVGESADLLDVLERVKARTLRERTKGWHAAELRRELPADPSAPALARVAVLAVAAGIPEPALLDAELLTSELVTHAVAAMPDEAETIAIRAVMSADTLRVEVEEPLGPDARPVREPGDGRDLRLVVALASRWGGTRDGDRYVTWFELDRQG